MATAPANNNTFINTFQHKCMHIFNKTPHPWQVDVGSSILRSVNINTAHNQLLVCKTGEGKSLVYLATGASLGGIILCISPLLSLAMDQTRKVLQHSPNTTSVTSFHLDEMSVSHINRLQAAISHLSSTTAIFLFTSPQALCNRNNFCLFLLCNHHIKFVVVDEVHLFAQFGNTFREEFGQLKVLLFDQLLQSPTSIPSLFMTVSCTAPMIGDIESLTGYTINQRHWPSPCEMSHRVVSIEVRYTKHHFRALKSTIAESLKPSQRRPDIARKVIIYTNTRSRARDFAFKLGKFLDTTEDHHSVDIITLVGTMTKEEKAFYTNMFLQNETNSSFKPDIMCATSGVGNAGIDSSRIGVIYRLGMPESIQDLYQEKGRAGRYRDSLAIENKYLLCFSIEDLLYLFRRSMNPGEEIINETYRQRKVNNLLLMAKVLASDICIALHIESILGNPELNHQPSLPCGSCPVCSNASPFLTIKKEGTKSVLLDLFVCGERMLNGKPNMKNILKALKDYPRIREKIVAASRSRLTMDPNEIKKVLFMLVAHGIMKLRYDKNEKEVTFQLAKSFHNDTVLALQYDPYWVNMSSYVDVDS